MRMATMIKRSYKKSEMTVATTTKMLLTALQQLCPTMMTRYAIFIYTEQN